MLPQKTANLCELEILFTRRVPGQTATFPCVAVLELALDLASLERRDPSASASRVLGLKECATTVIFKKAPGVGKDLVRTLESQHSGGKGRWISVQGKPCSETLSHNEKEKQTNLGSSLELGPDPTKPA